MRTLVWFRGKDLRVTDHAPLRDAVAGGELVPLFVLDPYFFAPERAARMPHRMQFLLESLAELRRRIAALGSRLVLVRGRSVDVVPDAARRWRVDRVVAHRWTEPFGRERDARVASALDVPFELYPGETLLRAEALRTRAGTPFAVYGAFARAARAELVHLAPPLAAPRRLPALPADVRVRDARLPTLASLGIEGNARLIAGGERAARGRLRRFLARPAERYDTARDDLGATSATSRLSADLKFGTLSVREAWHAAAGIRRRDARERFRAELLWRELAYYVLWHHPTVLTAPFRREFRKMRWRRDEVGWKAWQRGATGYPLVDAAARQLLAEGFVHNRARMVAASFLAKDLMIDFRRGEAHYLEWLVDGDWANNDLGWQWSAGTGCDAQPWFRVFNPIAQGERFDPDGAYVRRWVPELARMPAEYIHCPWRAPPEVLARAGVRLGVTYPRPIVDHADARRRFLAAARQMRL